MPVAPRRRDHSCDHSFQPLGKLNQRPRRPASALNCRRHGRPPPRAAHLHVQVRDSERPGGREVRESRGEAHGHARRSGASTPSNPFNSSKYSFYKRNSFYMLPLSTDSNILVHSLLSCACLSPSPIPPTPTPTSLPHPPPPPPHPASPSPPPPRHRTGAKVFQSPEADGDVGPWARRAGASWSPDSLSPHGRRSLLRLRGFPSFPSGSEAEHPACAGRQPPSSLCVQE